MEWTGQVYADRPTVAVQAYIDAPPGRVWALVSDIRLMARLSSELQEVEWLDGVTGPTLGRRFAGRNAHEALGTWETVSTIEYDEPRCFAWAVGDPGHPSATWRFTLQPQGEGTNLEQWVQMGPARSGLSLVTDEMVLATTLIGTEDMVRARLPTWRDVGVDGHRSRPAASPP